MRALITICFSLFLQVLYAQENSLLWKISGNGLRKPSYLYGTIHLKDARVFQFGDTVLAAFDACKAVAGELDMDSMGNPFAALRMVMMPKDTTLEMLLSEQDYAFVKQKAQEQLGNKAFLVDRMKPFFTAALFTLDDMQTDSTLSVDEYFQKRGKKRKMKVTGIESVQEQMNAINSISLKEQADMLVESLKETGETDDYSDKFIQLYLNQDIGKLEQAFHDQESSDMFMQSLLFGRNRIMADRIAVLIRKQPTFVAIGAGHLAGKEGVINLLKDKGYTLTPVFFHFNVNDTERKVGVPDASGGYLYESGKGDYQVRFPAAFRKEKTAGGTTVIADYEGALYSLEEDDPEGEAAEKYFDRKVKELKEANLAVSSVKKSFSGKIPVLLIEGSEGGIALAFEYYYLSSSRAVELAVTGTAEAVHSEAAKNFLDSLKLP